MAKTASEEFIAGKPAVYTGFDGKLYQAVFQTGMRNGLGVGSLQILHSDGTEAREEIIAGEDTARTFYWNLDATYEG